MAFVKGIDVSVYEPRIDWRVVRAQGVRFAIIRATSGIGYVDPCFADHWAGARRVGILRGAYHYLIAGQDPVQQADLFIATVGADHGELPPSLDIEDKYNETQPNKRIVDTAKVWLDRVEAAFGRRPMVYSRRTYFNEHVTTPQGTAPAWAKNYPLWVAQYPYAYKEGDMPAQPEGWQDWKFWQYSESGILDGIVDTLGRPTEVDQDWFRGALAELYTFANVQPPQPAEYIVQAGDTLQFIATKNNLELRELVEANPGLVAAGVKLTIPARIEIPEVPEEEPGGGGGGGGAGGGGGGGVIHVPVTYKVKSGDTLGAIALKFHTTVGAIAALNNITNVDLIFVGQVLVIPS